MLKTKLESLLETGFSGLGVVLGRREYCEEIMLGASVDDTVRPISVKEVRERIDNVKNEEERFIASFSNYDLSEYQNAVLRDTVPFFRRSVLCNGFKVVYNAVVSKRYAAYEPIADSLISEISLEVIELSWKGNSVADLHLGREVEVHIYISDNLAKYSRDINERLPFLRQVDFHKYNPVEVCEAVMKFLR